MSSNTSFSDAYSHLKDIDTQNGSTIGWDEINEREYWDADFLYLKKREYYRHLNRQNGGYKNGPKIANKRYQTYLANRDLIEILAGHLELTQRQEGRARNRFTGLPLRDLGMNCELVAYCTCAYVVHEDDASKRKCHPNTPDDDRDELFIRIAEDLELRESTVRSMYGKLQHRFGDIVDQPKDDNSGRDQYGPDNDVVGEKLIPPSATCRGTVESPEGEGSI